MTHPASGATGPQGPFRRYPQPTDAATSGAAPAPGATSQQPAQRPAAAAGPQDGVDAPRPRDKAVLVQSLVPVVLNRYQKFVANQSQGLAKSIVKALAARNPSLITPVAEQKVAEYIQSKFNAGVPSESLRNGIAQCWAMLTPEQLESIVAIDTQAVGALKTSVRDAIAPEMGLWAQESVARILAGSDGDEDTLAELPAFPAGTDEQAARALAKELFPVKSYVETVMAAAATCTKGEPPPSQMMLNALTQSQAEDAYARILTARIPAGDIEALAAGLTSEAARLKENHARSMAGAMTQGALDVLSDIGRKVTASIRELQQKDPEAPIEALVQRAIENDVFAASIKDFWAK